MYKQTKEKEIERDRNTNIWICNKYTKYELTEQMNNDNYYIYHGNNKYKYNTTN